MSIEIFLLILFLILIFLYLFFEPNSKVVYSNNILSNHEYQYVKSDLVWQFKENIGKLKAYNPSLIKTKDGFLVSTRVSDYFYSSLFDIVHLYTFFQFENNIYFHNLDRNFKTISTSYKKYINEKDYESKKQFEDPRLFQHNDIIYAIGAGFYDKETRFPIIMRLKNNLDLIDYKFFPMEHFKLPTTQKNWNFFHHNNHIYIHTDSYPIWRIYEYDIDKNEMRLAIEKDITDNIDPYYSSFNIRCSTRWVDFDEDHYLCCLHTKKAYPLKAPIMRTIFCKISKKNMIPTLISKPVSFNQDDIQFCSGLEIDGDTIYLGIGFNNLTSNIISVDKEQIDHMDSISKF